MSPTVPRKIKIEDLWAQNVALKKVIRDQGRVIRAQNLQKARVIKELLRPIR